MDIRTYSHDADSDVDAEQMTHFDPIAELNAYAAENERLRNELAAMESYWRNAESEATTAKADAAELGKALDMCIAERDGAFTDADLARAELGTLRDERTRLLAANVRLFHDNNALRAELDAMRQAHSVIMARMAAMGC